MRIKITINGKEIEALVDTGSQPNLLRNDVYQTIGKPDLKKADLQLHGFGQSYTIPKGYFTTQLEIDGDDFETKFYVVSDDAMKFPAMIGNDLLEDAELIVNRNGVHIIKSSPNQELPTAIVNMVEKLELDIGDNVDEGTKRKVEEIVNKYIPNKIKSTDVETVITVKDEEPVYSSPRRMSPSEKKILDEQVQEWIEKKIVEPCVSEYASPVVIAWKKDRSPRVCIDYRRLNKKIYKDRYPLPLIEDLLDKLRRTKVFSVLDLKSGFFHVPVAPDSRKYTAFVTSSGQYWFLKTPMGLSIAPPVFQRYINTAFRQLVQQGTILVYMDDIIILALDENEALERLQIVLKTASEYALMLEEFEYTIKHRSGTRMQHVDALSRFPVMYALSNELTTRIKRAQLDDEKIKAIIEVLKEKPYEDYTIIDGILYKFSKGKDLLVVPKGMQTEIIRNSHERGHFSVKKTEEIIRQDYYISNLNAKIIRVIENCIKCIINNKKAGRKEGLLHPIFKGSLPFQTYQVDHVGPMESTHKGYNHLFVVVDSFTKFVWVYPVKSTTSREVINKLELQKTTFGNPSQIVADRGTAFTSQEFKDYCISENIELKFITTGLPRANGQVERVNAIIVNVLAKLSTDNPTKWYQHVAAVQRAINSTYQRSIKRTPFELLTGARMRDKTDLKITELLQNEVVDQFDAERDTIRKEAIEQISKLQDENRRNFNKHRRKASQHRVGDLVAVKRTQLGPGLKLKPKYLGPYRIAKVKANDTYDVIRDGAHEGPKNTTTCAEYLKRWRDFELSSESDDSQEGRVWETMETRRREGAEEKTKEREDT